MVTKKIMLGVAAIATATALVFGASSFDKKPAQDSSIPGGKVLFSTLTFKYQPSTYTEPQVESQSNWELVDPADACTQESNDAACSFSINVPTGNESLYLNGNQPSSRVIIEATQNSSTSNHYVSALKENVSGTPALSGSVSNIIP